MEIRQAPLNKIKKAWEHQLNTSLSNSEWESIFILINESSLYARHWYILRLYTDKTGLKSDLSILLKCGPPLWQMLEWWGFFIHMFWACPSLENYWKEVFQTLSVILKIDLKPNPLVAIFGATGEDSTHVSPTQRCVLSFTSLLAQSAILVRWRDAARPSTLNG